MFLSGDMAKSFSPIMFFPFFKIAKEKGLSYSTLQHDAEIWPNFGLGNGAFASLTKWEPSGILVFLSNETTRIMWNGPKNWFLVSTKKDLNKNILDNFKDTDFAVTDLSHSRAIIEVEGQETMEVLKKGCPFNFNLLKKNNSINSTYNGIAFTVDKLNENPNKVRLFALRSFGESLYHSITDASLEFGFKSF